MRVQIVDNMTRRMASVLPPLIEESNDVRIAVAFVSSRGLQSIEHSVRQALNQGATMEFLVGLDSAVTEPLAVKSLYRLSQANSRVALYCHASITPASIYHPKLYLLKCGMSVSCIVGSSNLTEAGLARNIEVNALIEGSAGDEVMSDAYTAYNRLKFHRDRVVPDEELLALYSQLHERHRREQRQATRDPSARQLAATFKEKVSSLRRPTPTRRDLVGWLEIVYDSLPEGEFTNSHVYAHERGFQAVYPENLNVRAKVRQQLQVLRDMGFIQHLGTARWRKI